MRKRPAIFVGTVGAVGICAAIVLGNSLAATSLDNRTDPAITRGDTAFFAASQIDSVWADLVENYPAALPEGYELPASPPAFFTPDPADDPERTYFEVGLPQMIAAQYWRCAWLDAYLDPAGPSVSADEVAKALEAYATLPGVAENDETGLTQERLVEIADELKLDSPEAALNALDCQGAY